MRKISIWGKANPWTARLIIVSIHTLLVLAALFAGTFLYDESVILPNWMLMVSLLLYFSSIYYYPEKKINRLSFQALPRYVQQKVCDMMLVVTGVFMLCFLSNHLDNRSVGNELNATSIHRNSTVLYAGKKGEPNAVALSQLSRSERRQLLKDFRKQLRFLIHTSDNTALKIGLLLLTLVGAAALLYLIAGLSCSLSCNGNDGAAAVVLILGTSGVIALAVIATKRIFRHRRVEPNRNPEGNFQQYN